MMNNGPDSQEFWNHKRVMVTGGNGFLGKHVLSPSAESTLSKGEGLRVTSVEGNIVRKLHKRGADVCIVDIDRCESCASPLGQSRDRGLSCCV